MIGITCLDFKLSCSNAGLLLMCYMFAQIKLSVHCIMADKITVVLFETFRDEACFLVHTNRHMCRLVGTRLHVVSTVNYII